MEIIDRNEEEEVFAVPDEDTEEIVMEEEDEEEVKTKGIFRLSNPIEINGVMSRNIHYDFSKIKPVQYINVVKAVSKKESVQIPELNMSVQFNVFCKAADIPVAVLKTSDQKINEFTAMCALARDFLLSKQGEEDEVL